MRVGRFSCEEAKAGGYSCAEAKDAGYNPRECMEAGFTVFEGLAAGYPMADHLNRHAPEFYWDHGIHRHRTIRDPNPQIPPPPLLTPSSRPVPRCPLINCHQLSRLLVCIEYGSLARASLQVASIGMGLG
jgi:hypothetical protein